jgi:hypothetical protein
LEFGTTSIKSIDIGIDDDASFACQRSTAFNYLPVGVSRWYDRQKA